MRRRSLWGLVLAAVPAAGVLALAGTPAAGQATPSSFEAVAAADGIRAFVIVPGAPATANLFDGGAPVTQSLINGIGESVGFAAMPSPGEAALTLPSLVLPLVGAPSPPPYPLLARSEDPTTPEASVDAGAVSLSAKSTSRSSEASSTSGGASGGNSVGRILTSTTSRLDDAGGVTAESGTTIESFTVGGVFRIGAAHATATASRNASGDPSTASSFAAEGVSAAGVAIGISDKGILLPGQIVPVPDTSGLSPALDAAGIKVRYIAPRKIEDGIISAGLSIEVPIVVPGRTPATVTYTLGNTLAIARSAGDAQLGEPPVPLGSHDVGAPTRPSSNGSLESGGSVALPLVPEPTASSPPGPSSSTGSGARLAAATLPATTAAVIFYLVLVVGAVVALTGGLLVGKIGVKLAWTS